MGFWETLAFVGIWISAIILAVDTALKQASSVARYTSFIKAPLWGFAPIVLLTMSGVIFLTRTMLPAETPSPLSATAPTATSQPASGLDAIIAHRKQLQAKVPADLSDLSNADLNTPASAFVTRFLNFVEENDINRGIIQDDGSRTADQQSFAITELDRSMTNEFRSQFEADFNRLQSEYVTRLRTESPITVEVPTTGLVTSTKMRDAGLRIFNLTQRLTN